jgi:glycogen debranching enzyme
MPSSGCSGPRSDSGPSRPARGAIGQSTRERFLEPLLAHLNEGGLGHISEIADADAPHTPRGCPFQAWSMGEALRLQLEVLQDGPARVSNPRIAALTA